VAATPSNSTDLPSQSRVDAQSARPQGLGEAVTAVLSSASEAVGTAVRMIGRAPEIFFPGTVDPEGAVPIVVTAASEVRAIDFNVRPIPTVTVRGRVTAPFSISDVDKRAAVPLPRQGAGDIVRVIEDLRGGIQVTLMRAGSASNPIADVARRVFGSTRVNPDGTFEIQNVVRGSYIITATLRVRGPEYVGRARIEVGDADLNNVNMTLSAGVAIEGRLSVEQPPPAGFNAAQLRIQLQSTDSFSINRNTAVRNDGSFRLENVPPGEYRVFVANVQPGWYLESGTVGSQDAVNTPFTLSAGQDLVMYLQLGFTTGSVSGSVVDPKGLPYPGAMTVLVPDGPRRSRPTAYFAVPTDQNGNFNFNAVPAGNYKLFAWEEIPVGAYQDPAYLRRFEERGRPVRVERNSTVRVEATVIPPK
jgi:hypothetical protein